MSVARDRIDPGVSISLVRKRLAEAKANSRKGFAECLGSNQPAKSEVFTKMNRNDYQRILKKFSP